MRTQFFIITLIIWLSANIWADVTYLKYTDIKITGELPAYLDVIDSLETYNAEPLSNDISSEFKSFKFKESIYHISKMRKAKMTLVFIHGLYGGASQFKYFFDHMKEQGSDANAILLTLPGHYKDGSVDRPVKEANKEDWVEAVHNTLKIAKSLTDRVVVIGQSTGGLLAVYSAINFSQLVDGIILLEPALKVQNRIELATCLGKYFVKEAASVDFIAKMIGIKAPKGISVSMGCEVAKLANELLDHKFIQINNYDHYSTSNKEPLENAMTRMAEKINIPILIVNNVNDHTVDPNYNKLFAKSFKSKSYLEINQDKKTQHGSDETITTDRENPFYQYTCEFLLQNFAERNCLKTYYENNVRRYISPAYGYMNESEIKRAIEYIKVDHVSSVVCLTLDKHMADKTLCQRFKDMVNNNIQFWTNQYELYNINRSSFKNFIDYIKWRHSQFTEDEKKLITKNIDEPVEFFQALFRGTYYYDLNYIYDSEKNSYLRRLNFVDELSKEKVWFENSASLLKGKYTSHLHKREIIQHLHKKIAGFNEAMAYDAFKIIENNINISIEIAMQQYFLIEQKNYIDRLILAKNQRVVESAELERLVSEYGKKPLNCIFTYTFDIQEVKKVLEYLINYEGEKSK